ncbi:ABC transporter transmembrane region 2-domain-containing protein [Zopfochytrium polystomum]|nr:ABC transporter transmembrane region 2-domain-containing protein [Zopfochytrium polystomum]
MINNRSTANAPLALLPVSVGPTSAVAVATLAAIGKLTTTRPRLVAASAAGGAILLSGVVGSAVVRALRSRSASAPRVSTSSARLRQSASTASFQAAKNVARQLATDPEDESGPLRVDRKDVKVGVDRQFYKQIRYILAIAIPSYRHKTVIILVLHTAFLVLRTYLSVLVARVDGMIARDLISANGRAFLKSLSYWFLIALPATYTNSMIKYLQSKLSISLRTTLTEHVHDLYMENRTYYKAVNLDNRIDGADQLITTDINRFCNALAGLYSNLGKPLLDLIIFNYQLARSIGVSGMLALSVNYVCTAAIMRAVTPAFGKMAAIEAKLEGDFRTAHSRLITNAEEIAFYHGGDLELSILNRTYLALIKHINSIYNIRIGYNMFEDMIIKYSWSGVGFIIASIPVFFPAWAGGRTKREEAALASVPLTGEAASQRQTGSRTQGFITNKKLMLSLGRCWRSYYVLRTRSCQNLRAYTSRVYTLLRVLSDLHD